MVCNHKLSYWKTRMTHESNRREFIAALCMGSVSSVIDLFQKTASAPDAIKPIRGSWFEFQHHATVEGVDWNPALAQFTAEQWIRKLKKWRRSVSNTSCLWQRLSITAPSMKQRFTPSGNLRVL